VAGLRIAHLLETSLIDYPGRVAAVLFTAGCNFRCPFCHNPELVLPERIRELRPLALDEVLSFLSERRGFLDGLVVTGGEPTIQGDLAGFLTEVKQLGFLVKLDANGSRPGVLEDLIGRGLVDYVALDVKAPFERYPEFAGVEVNLEDIRRSIALVREKAPDYEFRTTVAPGLRVEDLRAIGALLAGARKWFLQTFVVPGEKGLVDPSWEGRVALSRSELSAFWEGVAARFPSGGVR
jgi:pyruvate formate lyase activating enzyme